MITLNQIREIIVNQDKELEDIIFKYFNQVVRDKYENKPEQILDVETYKKNTKPSIERLITENKFDEAKQLLEEYKKIVIDDISIFSIEGIIHLNESNLEEAYNVFKKGLNIDNKNVDLLYNIAYTSALLGNVSDSIKYYEQCLNSTEDNSLIKEINLIIEELVKNLSQQNYTIITLNIEEDDNLFTQIDKGENSVINIIEKEEVEYENKYNKDDLTICEVNPKNLNEVIEYLVRRNDKCIIICNDIYKLDTLSKLNEECKLIYYTNKNLYIDKSNYLNHSIDMYLEKEICNLCDLIITENINIYTCKKIIERRENIYLVSHENGGFTNIIRMLGCKNTVDENKLNNRIVRITENITDDYKKELYNLSEVHDDLDKCIDISKSIYEKYKTEEIYQIYLSLLNEKKDYESLVSLAINSDYCDEIFKSELIYLSQNQNLELIEFISDMSIKNYKNIYKSINNNQDYKIALFNYEINDFTTAYSKYINMLNDNCELLKSPLVNRNISYIMYASENKEYEKYYNNYTKFMESIYEN